MLTLTFPRSVQVQRSVGLACGTAHVSYPCVHLCIDVRMLLREPGCITRTHTRSAFVRLAGMQDQLLQSAPLRVWLHAGVVLVPKNMAVGARLQF